MPPGHRSSSRPAPSSSNGAGPSPHAAIVARELALPAVLNVAGAASVLDGRMVTVDGDRGRHPHPRAQRGGRRPCAGELKTRTPTSTSTASTSSCPRSMSVGLPDLGRHAAPRRLHRYRRRGHDRRRRLAARALAEHVRTGEPARALPGRGAAAPRLLRDHRRGRARHLRSTCCWGRRSTTCAKAGTSLASPGCGPRPWRRRSSSGYVGAVGAATFAGRDRCAPVDAPAAAGVTTHPAPADDGDSSRQDGARPGWLLATATVGRRRRLRAAHPDGLVRPPPRRPVRPLDRPSRRLVVRPRPARLARPPGRHPAGPGARRCSSGWPRCAVDCWLSCTSPPSAPPSPSAPPCGRCSTVPARPGPWPSWATASPAATSCRPSSSPAWSPSPSGSSRVGGGRASTAAVVLGARRPGLGRAPGGPALHWPSDVVPAAPCSAALLVLVRLLGHRARLDGTGTAGTAPGRQRPTAGADGRHPRPGPARGRW